MASACVHEGTPLVLPNTQAPCSSVPARTPSTCLVLGGDVGHSQHTHHLESPASAFLLHLLPDLDLEMEAVPLCT